MKSGRRGEIWKRGGNAISQRGSRSFSSNGPPTIIGQDLDDRIAPRARRQTSRIRSHVAGDIFPSSLLLSFSLYLSCRIRHVKDGSCARRRVWGETKEDTGQISGLCTLYNELRLIVVSWKGGRRRKWNYALNDGSGSIHL